MNFQNFWFLQTQKSTFNDSSEQFYYLKLEIKIFCPCKTKISCIDAVNRWHLQSDCKKASPFVPAMLLTVKKQIYCE